MKKSFINLTILFITLAFSTNASQERFEEIEKRLAEIEVKTYSSFLNFSGELETRYDNFTREDKDDSAASKNVSNSYFSNFFRLNLDAKPHRDVQFYGRLSMAKYWNDFYAYGNRPVTALSGSTGRNKTNGEVYVERAFINWSFAKSYILSIGRLPTIDGGPKHLHLSSSELGSYPLASFSAIFDGMALTKEFTGNGWNLKTRAIYTPFQTPNFSSTLEGVRNSDGAKLDSKSDVFVLNIDLKKYQMSFAESSSTILQIMRVNNLDFYTVNNGTTALGNNTASFTTLSFYNEFTNVLDTNTDLYLTYKYSWTKSKGCLIGSGTTCTTGGFYSNGPEKSTTGYNLWLGAKNEIFEENYIGFEYIYNDTYGTTSNSAKAEIANLYGVTASKTAHIFYTNHINSALSLIVGAYQQKTWRTFTGGVFTLGSPANLKTNVTYSRFIAHF
ncbi:DUF3373 family protein [Bacteriovorax sp. DB6_IX]|uniref:DUF3373 family protein n=1 Tax=Bacteriovorax sp. DB6_IX TaxID=1353530 RepID=UPI00038A2C0A|nr:DUF3373 family protein [Bacteriovorax sp. DB6_IX]EQC50461.1 PF11853 family protein [Bacteriovorax sp. DB6_IX]